jgi:tRNA 2-thiouridine synthesizing protein B
MILHTINTGPGSSDLTDCLRVAGAEDAILLTGDGVYIALEGTGCCSGLLKTRAEIFILESDAKAAGVMGRISSAASVVDFNGFVELTERFPRQIAWY